MLLDDSKRATDCYFLTETGRGTKVCAALKTFYNGRTCLNCPFFKTREEYYKGLDKYPMKETSS